MKIHKHILLFFSLVFISLISFAQTKNKSKAMDTVEVYTHAVDSYLRGLNEKDLEGILSLYADNATLEDPVGSNIIEGIINIRKFYSGAVILDLKLTRTGPVRIASNEAAFPFQLEMEVQGKLMRTDIIDVFRFDEQGKIVSMRAFWGSSNQKIVEEE
jgi:steroid delta-isomerase